MPFDIDCQDAPFRYPKIEMESVPIAPDKIERAAMSAFCSELSPADWLALEALGQRVRNAMLKQTVRIALRWRARRRRTTEAATPVRLVGPEREAFLKAGDRGTRADR